MNIVAIVQARLGSTRFPAKITATLCGRPLLAHVLERAQAIKGIGKVVLAVPDSDVRALEHLAPNVFGGDAHDVLRRYYECAGYFEADVIVRVTGDCPLLAPDLAERALKAFMSTMKGSGYLALCQPYCNVADGWDVEVFSRAILDEAQAKPNKQQREHVVTWMRDSGIVAKIPFSLDCRAMKLSVDTREDLARVKRVMEFLNDASDFSHIATWEAWQRAGRP